MKNTVLLLVIFFLFSCNNKEEIEKLKNENELLKKKQKLSKSDSLAIFNTINNDVNNRFAIKLLDSLKVASPKKYQALIRESSSRDSRENTDVFESYTDFER